MTQNIHDDNSPLCKLNNDANSLPSKLCEHYINSLTFPAIVYTSSFAENGLNGTIRASLAKSTKNLPGKRSVGA